MTPTKTPAAKRDNILLLTGENDFELKKFFWNWYKSSLEKYGEFNVSRFDFLERECAEIIGEIQAPPFFGEGKRVFFIENFPPPPPSRPLSDKKKASIIAFAEALANIPDDCVVIFVVPNPDKRTAAYKKVSELVGKVQSFPAWAKDFSGALSREGESDATEWIMRTVTEKQGKILPAAARFLLEYCGADPWKLHSEIEKLVLFSNDVGKPIAEADIKKLALPSDEMANFAFSNALQSGDFTKVIEVFEQLMESGEAPQAIFARDLVSSFRQLIQVRMALDDHQDAKSIGVHPFVFSKLSGIAKKFPLPSLLQVHRRLLQLDIDSKTGRLPITSDKTELFHLEVERILIDFFLGRSDTTDPIVR